MSERSEAPEQDDASRHRSGWFVRLSARLSPGVRRVQAQIGPYAKAWEEANARAREAAGPLWVALGDSMTQAIGASRYDCGWVSQLQGLLEQAGETYRVINLSAYGARVEDVLTRQLPAMRALDAGPDLVTVLIGSNDIVSRRSRGCLLSNYAELLAELPRGAVIASPFGNVGLGKQVNELIAAEASRRGLRVLDNRQDSSFASWKGKLAEDHFHPNDRGYTGLAQAFLRALQGPA
ncbi:MAG TPA: SGNH/GDSL hydrolase family protein [Solirubrobacteraceae bacterium]